jgi:hypothetical protein
MIRSKRSLHVRRDLSSEYSCFLYKFSILQTADCEYSADSIDPLVEMIVSCLVLCFLLRYADVPLKSRPAIKEEDARRDQARREWPEADRQQGVPSAGNLLEQRHQ